MQPPPPIVEWAQKHLRLNNAYVYPGSFRPRPWQVEPLNAPGLWHRVRYLGPTQTGKSTMADVVMYYTMAVRGISGMVAYDRMETVTAVFKTRIVSMIKDNESIAELWDHKEDSLTLDNLVLRTCVWRVASARNERTMSTFPAGMIIGSEVGKWERQTAGGKKSFSPIETLRGRAGAYWSIGGPRELLESTPFEPDDYMYTEVFSPGVLILQPHISCPHCGYWQVLIDSQIKLRDSDADHKPARLRAEKSDAVRYECAGCAQEITEAERAAASATVIWAAPEIDQKDFQQKAEKISRSGEVEGAESRQRKNTAVCYNWNRLVDVAYPFWECLAKFFESKNDPEKLKTYQTETMARYVARKTSSVAPAFIKSRLGGYKSRGPEACFPAETLVLTAGIDSQDDGFYYLVVGWMPYMEFCLVEYDHIKCPISQYNDRRQVLKTVSEAIFSRVYRREDGVEMGVIGYLIDRGGHRADDVDYIVERVPNCEAYVGLTRNDPKRPWIYKSEKDNFYLGQTEEMSDHTGKMLSGSGWYMMDDYDEDFVDQLTSHRFEEVVDENGVAKTAWIRPKRDHYRDCFILAYAAARLRKLDRALYSDGICRTLDLRAREGAMVKAEPQKTTGPTPEVRRNINRGGGAYYSRAYGRGWR